jgi:hypothetical protein
MHSNAQVIAAYSVLLSTNTILELLLVLHMLHLDLGREVLLLQMTHCSSSCYYCSRHL